MSQIRGSRELLRKAMGAAESRFHELMNGFEPARCADHDLQQYVRALVRDGWVGHDLLEHPDRDELITAAQTMLVGALWGDAMAREHHDDKSLWVPETRAARRYVQMFLRNLGITDAVHGEPVSAAGVPSTRTTSLT